VFAASIGGEYSRSHQCEYTMVNVDTCHLPRVFAANTRVSVKQPLDFEVSLVTLEVYSVSQKISPEVF